MESPVLGGNGKNQNLPFSRLQICEDYSQIPKRRGGGDIKKMEKKKKAKTADIKQNF